MIDDERKKELMNVVFTEVRKIVKDFTSKIEEFTRSTEMTNEEKALTSYAFEVELISTFNAITVFARRFESIESQSIYTDNIVLRTSTLMVNLKEATERLHGDVPIEPVSINPKKTLLN